MDILEEFWRSIRRRLGGATDREPLEPALASRLFAALGLTVVLLASFGVWAGVVPIAGAVIASGFVVVDTNIKKVQHPTGGVVAAILVKNGDRVNAGDIVLSLDEVQPRANLGVVVSQLTQLTGRKARLEAERDQAASIRFPAGFLESWEDASEIAAGEIRLFNVRQAAKNGQVAQLRERIGQLQQEVQGLTAQREAKDKELALMTEELQRLEHMRKKDLVPVTRILSSQRDLTRLRGEWGSLVAQIARAQGQISEIELQIISLDQTMQTDATKELRDIEARIAELQERRIAAADQLRRIHVRAPQSGVVHDLTVHTVGGVINPGEAIMMIVPSRESLSVEVRIAPADIDQVSVGQQATLRFPALNQRTTPEFKGVVTYVGADLTKEAQTNTVYFAARVQVQSREGQDFRIVPGMPAEAYIATDARTTLSYLMKPLTDQLAKAFRER